MLLRVEIDKDIAKNLDLLKAFIGRAVNLNLHGWELYIDMQTVTISLQFYAPLFTAFVE